MKHKIEYLQGIRGIANVIVFVAHSLRFIHRTIFFMASHSFWLNLISQSPANLIFNRHFVDIILFVLSGPPDQRKFERDPRTAD